MALIQLTLKSTDTGFDSASFRIEVALILLNLKGHFYLLFDSDDQLSSKFFNILVESIFFFIAYWIELEFGNVIRYVFMIIAGVSHK